MSQNTKIIFLDIDGVLNTHKYTVQMQDEPEHAYKFLDRNKIKLLKNIVEATNAKLVLSSTWKKLFNENLEPIDYLGIALTEALKNEELTLYAKTEELNGNRYAEIKNWLESHPEVSQFIVLDDNDYDWQELRPHWIKTSYYIGLTENIAQNIIGLLNA